MVSEKILIVEDEQTVAEIIAINLRLEGFDVDVALNGTTGLKMALEGRYDLVISDVMMPDVDGYQICRQVKDNSATGKTPVILLTARTDIENKVAGLDAGADDFVTKPFDFGELLKRINMNLDRAAQRYAADSVTGLPGNITADDSLKAVVLSGEPFSFMMIKIKGMRPFREVYGDERLESVVRFTAKSIEEALADQGAAGDMVTYLGAGTFGVLTVPERVEALAGKVIARFDGGVTDFYEAGDLERGGIVTFDRRGSLVDNPLMSVSIGASSNSHRRIRSHWEAAEIAREVLDYAATFPGSKYLMDRRQ